MIKSPHFKITAFSAPFKLVLLLLFLLGGGGGSAAPPGPWGQVVSENLFQTLQNRKYNVKKIWMTQSSQSERDFETTGPLDVFWVL